MSRRRLRTITLTKPRSLCTCQPVADISSFRVARPPSLAGPGPWSSSRRGVFLTLLPGRRPARCEACWRETWRSLHEHRQPPCGPARVPPSRPPSSKPPPPSHRSPLFRRHPALLPNLAEHPLFVNLLPLPVPSLEPPARAFLPRNSRPGSVTGFGVGFGRRQSPAGAAGWPT